MDARPDPTPAKPPERPAATGARAKTSVAGSGGPAPLPLVAVPARDEEQRLPALLTSLSRQSWSLASGVPLPVIVVLNNCTDASAAAARTLAATLPGIALDLVEVDLPPAEAHVGSARRLALDLAAARAAGADDVILTTDADAVPDRDWVEENLAAIARGADLVGGHLYADPDEEARLGPGFAVRAAAIADYERLCDRYAALVDPLEHDPWPRHRDHTGASLAVRAGLYRAVGGLPALGRREDLAFVDRVRAAGGTLVHPLAVRVMVSARLSGRAEGGMADCLKEWMRAEAEGAPILVRNPHSWRDHLLRRRAVRDLARLPADERAGPAIALGLRPEALPDGDFHDPGSAFVARHATEEPDMASTVPVSAAIAVMRDMIRQEEGRHRAA